MTPPRYLQEWVDLEKDNQTMTIVSPVWEEGDLPACDKVLRMFNRGVQFKMFCGWRQTAHGISEIPVPDFTPSSPSTTAAPHPPSLS